MAALIIIAAALVITILVVVASRASVGAYSHHEPYYLERRD